MSANGLRQLSDSFAGALNEARAASTAGGGTSLTTTAAIVGLPNGTSHVAIVARNFAANATVVKVALNPYLHILKTTDSLANVTSYSKVGQQNPASTGVVFGALNTLANGNAMFVGSFTPFRGMAVTMSASVNAAASTLLAEYWNGSAWVSLNATDGTANGGATFAQTGNITWTVPTAWATTLLPSVKNPVVSPVTALNAEQYIQGSKSVMLPLYWTRLTVSATLTAGTTANTIFSLNRSTAYAEMVADSLLQFRTPVKGVDLNAIGCIEALTDAGTANLIVNCYTDSVFDQF